MEALLTADDYLKTVMNVISVKDVTSEDSNYWTKMMNVIRQEIQDYRSELDAFTMKRTHMERVLKKVMYRVCWLNVPG